MSVEDPVQGSAKGEYVWCLNADKAEYNVVENWLSQANPKRCQSAGRIGMWQKAWLKVKFDHERAWLIDEVIRWGDIIFKGGLNEYAVLTDEPHGQRVGGIWRLSRTVCEELPQCEQWKLRTGRCKAAVPVSYCARYPTISWWMVWCWFQVWTWLRTSTVPQNHVSPMRIIFIMYLRAFDRESCELV